jgi:xanthine dehydrogenase YagR molybdenum-binding subunit
MGRLGGSGYMSNEFVSNAGTDGAKIIGGAVPRVDGPLKTTGSARYASDYNFPGLVYAVPV